MKIFGYIASLLGVLVLVSSRIPQMSEKISSVLKFIPKENFPKYSIYLGLGLIIVGILILIVSMKSGQSSNPSEVPIYHGNKIVGYRRQ
ncbi:MAG: hypothetical protein QXX68_00895 [Candidatus Pacearchaeota archaeon]